MRTAEPPCANVDCTYGSTIPFLLSKNEVNKQQKEMNWGNYIAKKIASKIQFHGGLFSQNSNIQFPRVLTIFSLPRNRPGFLKSKVCKFFSWSEVCQNFWPVWFHFYEDSCGNLNLASFFTVCDVKSWSQGTRLRKVGVRYMTRT